MSFASPPPAAGTAGPQVLPAQVWQVSQVNEGVRSRIANLDPVWVEGEISELKAHGAGGYAYGVLQDLSGAASTALVGPKHLFNYPDGTARIKRGDHVMVLSQPDLYVKRGTFQLKALKVQSVGLGQILEQLERLKRQLAQEGLFDPAHKKPLPLVPKRIGLITGRASAAEQDVQNVARARWPEVDFEVRNTQVQGADTVPQVIAALQELDAIPEVEVIIIARGGGSVEDLFPFSNEQLVRAVAAAKTPVVSAIGHEPDTPLLDNVADLRAATPTDAAKRVVPDAAALRAELSQASQRLAAAVRGWVDRQEQGLAALRSRPVLADPLARVRMEAERLGQLQQATQLLMRSYLEQETSRADGLRARVAALGPAATLERGYAVVQVVPRQAPHTPEVLTSIEQAPLASQLRIRLLDGSLGAVVMEATPAPS